MTHQQYLKKALKDPGFKREYEALSLEYGLKRRIIELGIAGKYSLKNLAAESGLSQASILRLQRGELSDEISTLSKITMALGMKSEVRMV